MVRERGVVRWRLPVWVRPTVLVAGWAALVVWGSLLPMQFDGPGYVAEHGGVAQAVWAALRTPAERTDWGRTDAVDIVVNALLYVPLGLLLREALRDRRRRRCPTGRLGVWESGWWWRSALGVAMVAGLSWALESTQALAAWRVPAASDWVLNAGPGALAVVFGPVCVDAARRLAFWGYTRSAAGWDAGVAVVRGWQRRPRRLRLLAAGAAALTVLGGYGWLADRGLPMGWAWNAMPFGRHFRLPYDDAARHVLVSMTAYGLAAMWLALPWMQTGLRRRLGGVLAGVLLLSVGVEAIGWGRGVRTDVTQPVLAVMGAGAAGLAYAMGLATVRFSCRRRGADPGYAGPERRRRSHAYSG